MITICGASGDCIEVDIEAGGCEDTREFYADGKGRWQADLVGPGGTGQMRVRAEFSPDGSGCWVISLSQAGASIPFPDWPSGIHQAMNGYSTLVHIAAPAGTRLANVSPEPRQP
jgi:hypothetical protein